MLNSTSIVLLSIKDIAKELDCSESTAKRHAKDIRAQYNLSKRIPKAILYEYFLQNKKG